MTESKKEMPPGYGYWCSGCGAAVSMLWRECETLVDRRNLLCTKCAAKQQRLPTPPQKNEETR